jgi:hypothetical protein
MAAERNLDRIRQSCERIATGDPESGEKPLITMEDCYTIDGNKFMKQELDQHEEKKFGEKRIDRINEYTLEYRKRQKNLLIRRDLINGKFDEILQDIQTGMDREVTEVENIENVENVEPKKIEKPTNIQLIKVNQRKINIKNSKKIRELQTVIENLRRKLEKNNNDYRIQIQKYSKLGKNEENIRKKLGITSWDKFAEKVNGNKFNRSLDQLLDDIEQTSDNIDDSSSDDFDIKIPDKDANDNKDSEARRNATAKETDETTVDKNSEGFANPTPEDKLALFNKNIGRKLAVYENIGAIRVAGRPIIAARANKIVLNSIELVSDFETFIVDVIASIRDRYYNNEDVDYKKLVEQTQTIDENYIQRDLLSDANHVSKKQYSIETKRKQKLESTTRVLGIVTAIIFVVALLLVGSLIRT